MSGFLTVLNGGIQHVLKVYGMPSLRQASREGNIFIKNSTTSLMGDMQVNDCGEGLL